MALQPTLNVPRPEDVINFTGHDWQAIKAFLMEKLDTSSSLLCSDLSHDESNKIRGTILLAKTILNFETAARAKLTGPQ